MEEKNYKKLYEDVVALAKDGLKDGLYLSRSAKEATEFLFPQLKETEDEKARRELTTFLIGFNNGYYSRPSEDKIDSWIKWIDKKASDIEKQCEQNAVDEVKPKFKVGDWIVQENIGIYKVIEICESWYEVLDNKDNHYSIGFDKEDMCHLWAIQDANDGDVLFYDNGWTCIFKHIHGIWYSSYCFITTDGEFHTGYEGHSINAKINGNVNPATKEQRDILFQKMKKAGYEWDAEKKELNKIEQKYDDSYCKENCKGFQENGKCFTDLDCKDKREAEQKSSWSENDEKMWVQVINEIEAIKSNSSTIFEKNIAQDKIDWLKSIKDRVHPQPKQEWSKEDSERLLRIHQFIWANRKGDTDEIYQQEQDADWLMSIIPQPNQYDKGYEDGYSAAKYNQWKPTDKQMEDFRMLLDYNIGVFDYAKFMSVNSLYDDLKKNLID